MKNWGKKKHTGLELIWSQTETMSPVLNTERVCCVESNILCTAIWNATSFNSPLKKRTDFVSLGFNTGTECQTECSLQEVAIKLQMT